MKSSSSASAPRLAEVVAAFSLATDLGLGQPMEHGLRSCLIATRLAEALDFEEEQHAAIYWVALLAMAGCTADSSEMTEYFGDDIEFRKGMFDVGPSQTAMPRYLVGKAGSDGGPISRVRATGSLLASGMKPVMEGFLADCAITSHFAERLGVGSEVSQALSVKFARWDGKGIPKGLAGDEIPLSARVLGISWRAEAAARDGGAQAASAVLSEHSGATLDPTLVTSAIGVLPSVLDSLEGDSWDAVVAAEPARPRLIGEAFDSALMALGDFADLKSRWFAGHSRAISELSEAAGWRLGLSQEDVDHLRRSALVHSIGRTGVANTIWDKRGSLTVAERERMQLYPYLTDRTLRQGSLKQFALTASSSQERIDGSGYPRGASANSISLAGRILAAVDVYQSMCELRPHRPAVPPEEAAAQLGTEAREGKLDREAVEAVLAAAGHRDEVRRSLPAGLTEREAEVLRLIARGLTSANAADKLGIKLRTVNTHVEHIYAKIGASNRSTATLFAMEHGLA